jgi:hypothetical protein
MLVVIPVCEKDAELAIRNIEHCLTLDGKCEFKAIVATERSFDSQPVLDAAARYFSGVDHCVYEDYKGDPQWPRPQNYAWQNVAQVDRAEVSDPVVLVGAGCNRAEAGSVSLRWPTRTSMVDGTSLGR